MADLNGNLVGVPGSRFKLQTPALVVDLDSFERNLARMAGHARACDIALRPHAKTHKCAEIARRQIALGALGICCAKLGEAEALADAGIGSILITSPIVSDAGMERLLRLNQALTELMVVCDNEDVATRLARASAARDQKLKVLVDIDPGMSRTGVRPELAEALVQMICDSPSLEFAGLQCYAGQVQHLEAPAERKAKSLEVMARLGQLRDHLASRKQNPRIVSGGGTGTFDIDPGAKVLTELQVGSYVFMDRQYNDVWEKPGEKLPFETSLFVYTSVISANRDGLATTDAGFKSFATDAEAPRIARGAPDGASYFFFGDEQGGVLYDPSRGKPAIGEMLACVVPHCDPTVNLYDRIHAVRGDRLEAIWPVEARGRSA